MPSESNESFERRVTRLETGLDNLSSTVDAGFATMFTKLDNLGERNRITWPLLFTAIGTLVSVAIVAGTIHMLSLQPLVEAVITLRKDVETHHSSRGHTSALITSENNMVRLKNLEKQVDEHAKEEDHPLGVVRMIEHLRGELKALAAKMEKTSNE